MFSEGIEMAKASSGRCSVEKLFMIVDKTIK